jgi:hypothetical protein
VPPRPIKLARADVVHVGFVLLGTRDPPAQPGLAPAHDGCEVAWCSFAPCARRNDDRDDLIFTVWLPYLPIVAAPHTQRGERTARPVMSTHSQMYYRTIRLVAPHEAHRSTRLAGSAAVRSFIARPLDYRTGRTNRAPAYNTAPRVGWRGGLLVYSNLIEISQTDHSESLAAKCPACRIRVDASFPLPCSPRRVGTACTESHRPSRLKEYGHWHGSIVHAHALLILRRSLAFKYVATV